MIDILEKVEPQPLFPREDLTENNANLLSLVLANLAINSECHEKAELIYPLLAQTHLPLMQASYNQYGQGAVLLAIDHGIQTFEALTFCVRAKHEELNNFVLRKNSAVMLANSSTSAQTVNNYFLKIHEEFAVQMPNTAEVIIESAGRFTNKSDYVRLGSAIARQFELDCSGEEI